MADKDNIFDENEQLEYKENLSDYEAFRDPKALEAFIHDLEEEDRMLKNGEIVGKPWDEFWSDFEKRKKDINARLQDSFSSKHRKGA